MKKLIIIVTFMLIITGCSSINQETLTKLEAEIEKETQITKQLKRDLADTEERLNLTKDELLTTNDIVQSLESDKATLENDIIIFEEKVAMLDYEEVDEIETLGPTPGLPLLLEATNLLQAIVTEDFATLSLYVTTTDGLRLSPYQFVDITNDIVLTPTEVANWLTLPTTYLWGSYDGSGDPISKTADLYFYEFVKDEDYMLAPLIGNNVILSSGNLINNIISAYPGTSLVEYYYPEFDPSYGGLDWKSLTLVMKNISGEWYLVGIVHGQWTT